MNRLQTLKKDLTDMTDEELRQHIARVRRDRVMTKRPRGEAKKKAVKKDEGNRKLKRLVEGMTEEERQALMKELGDD